MPSTPKELIAEESLEVITEDVVIATDVPEVVVQEYEQNQPPCHQDANQDVEVGSEKEPSAKEAVKEDKLSEAANTIAASENATTALSQVQSIDASSSAPGSRKSTLKRPKKKRSSLDGSTSTGSTHTSTNSSLSRPVLISDGDFDVASAAAALRAQKNAFEVLDEAKLKELQDKTVMDTLFVSDIGHGMASGPINMGRFGLGKYIPPDRSEEIYPIPMQQKDDEASEDSEEKANATSSTEIEEKPLKSMLEEVLRNAGTRGSVGPTGSPSAAKSSLTTYIRDAARFTELAPHSEEHCSAAASAAAAGTVPLPGIPSTPSAAIEPLMSKANISKKQDDLDLD